MTDTPCLCHGRPVPARIGTAKLTKMAFDGADFGPLWNNLLEEIAKDPSNAAAAMDMGAIAQLLGDRKNGLALQTAALSRQRLYRLPCRLGEPRLRVLAFAVHTDIGGNTPIEFLLEESDIELHTLYVLPDAPVPNLAPVYDVAIVVAPASESTRVALAAIDAIVRDWPCPVLNAPRRIAELDRDRLHLLLKSVPGLAMPATVRVSRSALLDIASETTSLRDTIEDGAWPLIIRPVDSHAGRGLAKLDRVSEIDGYLAACSEEHFFISRYIDYSGADGLFRKYRVIFVDGRPYACHMAISDQWKIWYLNAEMAKSVGKRAEEEHFFATFDDEFAKRHQSAFNEMARRIGLEYFAIDCAETKAGEMLLFEADNAMIVHNMDPPSTYPYKPAQMRSIFEAFAAMLQEHASRPINCAA